MKEWLKYFHPPPPFPHRAVQRLPRFHAPPYAAVNKEISPLWALVALRDHSPHPAAVHDPRAQRCGRVGRGGRRASRRPLAGLGFTDSPLSRWAGVQSPPEGNALRQCSAAVSRIKPCVAHVCVWVRGFGAGREGRLARSRTSRGVINSPRRGQGRLLMNHKYKIVRLSSRCSLCCCAARAFGMGVDEAVHLRGRLLRRS